MAAGAGDHEENGKESGMPGDLVLTAGRAHPELSAEIAAYLGTRLAETEVSQFSDGEVFVQVNENVRGADVSSSNLPASRSTRTSWSC